MTAPGGMARTAAAGAVLLALLAAGCTSRSVSIAEAPSAPVVPAPSSAPGDAATGAAAACGDDLAALDAVITEQLDAFAADDWDRAFALTSREFRAAGIDAHGLREIVTAGYPEAADAADHQVVGCLFGDGEAQVLIKVTAMDGATLDLVYLLTRERGDWRISGAVEHGTAPSEPGTSTA